MKSDLERLIDARMDFLATPLHTKLDLLDEDILESKKEIKNVQERYTTLYGDDPSGEDLPKMEEQVLLLRDRITNAEQIKAKIKKEEKRKPTSAKSVNTNDIRALI